MVLDFQTHDAGLGFFGFQLIVEFNVDCAGELAILVFDKVDTRDFSENSADAVDLRFVVVSWKIDNFDFAIQSLLGFLSTLDNVALP